jgi:hypothetical protein
VRTLNGWAEPHSNSAGQKHLKEQADGMSIYAAAFGENKNCASNNLEA